jgi:hypothetical protein
VERQGEKRIGDRGKKGVGSTSVEEEEVRLRRVRKQRPSRERCRLEKRRERVEGKKWRLNRGGAAA